MNDLSKVLDELDVPIGVVETRRYPGAFSSDEPTPYQKAAASDPILGQDLSGVQTPLFNARMPHYAIKHERFEHRVICFLKAEGLSNLEIAKRTGMTAVAISNIIRQPWAQKLILDTIHENGGDAVGSLLKGAATDAVMRLITEMDNDNARPAERITAADKLLDRLYGKPNQPIEHGFTKDPVQMPDEEIERVIRANSRAGTFTETTP